MRCSSRRGSAARRHWILPLGAPSNVGQSSRAFRRVVFTGPGASLGRPRTSMRPMPAASTTSWMPLATGCKLSPPDTAGLHARGRWPPPAGPRVAIVGSRRPSPYGEAVAEQLATELAGAGVVVVSGLALGIDAAAHRGALLAGGVTVAVMGTGVDIIYPAAHARLADEIL